MYGLFCLTLSVSVMSSKLNPFVPCINISVLFYAEKYSIVWIDHILFRDLSVDRFLGCFWKVKESEVAQLCPTLCNPMDFSPPGSSIHGILQARILKWVAISFSRGSSWPRDRTQVSHIAGRHFNLWATREAQSMGFFYFVAIMVLIAMKVNVQDFVWTYVFNSLGYIHRKAIVRSHGNSMFNFFKTPRLFPTEANHFTLPLAV